MNESENLQYFPFNKPQQVSLYLEDNIINVFVLGYWQDLSSPDGKTYYNQAIGKMNATGYDVTIPSKGVEL